MRFCNWYRGGGSKNKKTWLEASSRKEHETIWVRTPQHAEIGASSFYWSNAEIKIKLTAGWGLQFGTYILGWLWIGPVRVRVNHAAGVLNRMPHPKKPKKRSWNHPDSPIEIEIKLGALLKGGAFCLGPIFWLILNWACPNQSRPCSRSFELDAPP